MATQQEFKAVIGGVFMTLKGAGQIVTQIIEANERPSDDLMARLALVAAGIEYGKDTLLELISPAAPTAADEPPLGSTPEQAAWFDLVGKKIPGRLDLLGQNLEG
jgi:hypothetical protein